jgi:hypothetical protein
MLDESWKLATRFGLYEVSFDETLQSASGSRRMHLTFDIVGITYMLEGHVRDFLLDAPPQEIIRVILEQDQYRPRVQIADVQLLGRCEARAKNSEASCRHLRQSLAHSNSAFNRVSFRTWEWDYYGKRGTILHHWNFLWWSLYRIIRTAIIPALLIGLVLLFIIAYFQGGRRFFQRLWIRRARKRSGTNHSTKQGRRRKHSKGKSRADGITNGDEFMDGLSLRSPKMTDPV